MDRSLTPPTPNWLPDMLDDAEVMVASTIKVIGARLIRCSRRLGRICVRCQFSKEDVAYFYLSKVGIPDSP